jgi:hypothetical protein
VLDTVGADALSASPATERVGLALPDGPSWSIKAQATGPYTVEDVLAPIRTEQRRR